MYVLKWSKSWIFLWKAYLKFIDNLDVSRAYYYYYLDEKIFSFLSDLDFELDAQRSHFEEWNPSTYFEMSFFHLYVLNGCYYLIENIWMSSLNSSYFYWVFFTIFGSKYKIARIWNETNFLVGLMRKILVFFHDLKLFSNGSYIKKKHLLLKSSVDCEKNRLEW